MTDAAMGMKGRFRQENLKRSRVIVQILLYPRRNKTQITVFRGTFDLIPRKIISYVFLSVTLCATLPQAAFSETTNRSPYNSQAVVDYEEIDDFEVKSFPLRMAHPYEIVIPDTSLGQVIACRIYEAGDVDAPDLPETPGLAGLFAERPEGIRVNRHSGSFRDTQFVDSQNNRTHVYFAHKISDATFRCFNAEVGR